MTRSTSLTPGRSGAVVVLAAGLLLGPRPTPAAFESAPWGGMGGVPPGAGLIQDCVPERRFGVGVATRRWEAVPEVAWRAARIWARRGHWGLGVSAERLGVPAYVEDALRITLGSGRAAGWSGAVSGGWARWGATGASRRTGLGGVSAAWQATGGIRARMAAESAPGAAGGAFADRWLVAAEARVGPGWSVGVALETLGAGPRWHLDTLCRFADLALGCRVTPAEGSFALSVGYRAGPLAVDVLREAHPRLGGVTTADVAAGFGPEARP